MKKGTETGASVLRKPFGKRCENRGVDPNRSTVVLRGSRGATVYGCRKILLYTPQKISLKLSRDVLTVFGKGLYCTAFCAGTVNLAGEIGQVRFEGVFKATCEADDKAEALE